MVSSGNSLASRLGALLGAAHLTLAIGCVRDPLPVACAEVAAGDLVITELRGKQTGNSSYRQWIEVYNASDAAIDLSGLRLVFTQKNGKATSFFVRGALELSAGEYATLGGGDPEEFPYIDYDYTVDMHTTTSTDKPRDLLGSARLELDACGTVVDTINYTLPALGTLALDGTDPPDAAANDSADGWCVDTRKGPSTGLGIPGSPQEANPACE